MAMEREMDQDRKPTARESDNELIAGALELVADLALDEALTARGRNDRESTNQHMARVGQLLLLRTQIQSGELMLIPVPTAPGTALLRPQIGPLS